MPQKKPSTFEDNFDVIVGEINKRRSKWQLTGLAWLDYDDVRQIILIHINKKWAMYDQNKPLLPWLNTIISHQTRNLIRNLYSSHSRPCVRCSLAEGENGCRLYGLQSAECNLYAHWLKGKKQAHDIKLPLPMENHSQEVFNMPQEGIDVEKTMLVINEKMATILKAREYKVYCGLYIDGKSKEQIAKEIGFKTNEKGRLAGYKRIKQIEKMIIAKVKDLLYGGKIDFKH